LTYIGSNFRQPNMPFCYAVLLSTLQERVWLLLLLQNSC